MPEGHDALPGNHHFFIDLGGLKHLHWQRQRSSPDRYPNNADSLGIEIVGAFDARADREAPSTKLKRLDRFAMQSGRPCPPAREADQKTIGRGTCVIACSRSSSGIVMHGSVRAVFQRC
ncbi:hypothetical protein [Plasticicumulans acidivorans]|uniref:hypothetical protein n=1 Tax=Plasticicumulans acidivorans TaxID=886464 RepID=UPI0011B73403|nr:hypothetical protein [Plasticicumulans acidivorans]